MSPLKNNDDSLEGLSTAQPRAMVLSLLSSLILMGLGAIGGFGAFHFSFHQRVQTNEETHNETLALVEDRLLSLQTERNRCFENDDGHMQELSELRGRLDAQYKTWYELKASEKAWKEKHEQSNRALEHWRVRYNEDKLSLEDLQSNLEETNRELNSLREGLQRSDSARGDLESQLKREQERFRNEREQMDHQRSNLQTKIKQSTEEMNRLLSRSEHLSGEKEQIQHSLQNTRERLLKMETQIAEKDMELAKYKQEEGNVQAKLENFREGMLTLLKEKINEVQVLEEKIANLQTEKADLESKLDNWRDGMLALVREKMMEIENLHQKLAQSRENTEEIVNEVNAARMDQEKAEVYFQTHKEAIEESDPEFDKERIEKLKQEMKVVQQELSESRNWVAQALKEIETGNEKLAESEKIIGDKTREIEDLKSRIEIEQRNTNEEFAKLQLDLEEAQQLLKIKTSEVEELNSELVDFMNEINGLKSGLGVFDVSPDESTTSEIMINHVQQRDSVMCRQLFGKGPYYVKFVIRLPSRKSGEESTAVFAIELPFRKDLPHATYTFLTLVESNLYNNGSAFLFVNEKGLYVGNNPYPNTPTLKTKLKPLGLTGGASLSFQEKTKSENHPLCGKFSIGFYQRGPELNLITSEVSEPINDCFGRVIRGEEKLLEIQQMLIAEDRPLEIISVTHLRVD